MTPPESASGSRETGAGFPSVPMAKASGDQIDSTLLFDRPVRAVIVAMAGLLIGGALGGVGLAWLLAPGSPGAQFVGFITLPLVFGLGYKAWIAQTMAILAGRAFRGFLVAMVRALFSRQRPDVRSVLPSREQVREALVRIRAAARVFTWAGWMVGIPAGLLMGIFAPAGRFWWTAVPMLAVAVLYGRLCTRLARAGYLRPPEEF